MIRSSLRLAAALLVAPFAHAGVEFVGLIVTSHGSRFALTDTGTGRTEWLAPGEALAGHVVRSFDAAHDTLVVTHQGVERRIKLKDEARVKPSRLELAGSIRLGGTEKIEIESASLIFGQENVFSLQSGLTYRIHPTQLEDGNIQLAIVIERALAAGQAERISAPRITVSPGQSFSLKIGEQSFSFRPRPQ